MKRNSILFALASVATLGLSANAFAADPQGGVINFTGTVVDSSCYVEVGSTNMNVTLPTVDKGAFMNVGDTTGLTPFTITVNGCSPSVGANTVAVAFTPDSSIDANGKVLNAAVGGASVSIELLDKDQNPINIVTETSAAKITRGYPTVNAMVPMQFYARYIGNESNATMTAGAVTGKANFTLQYQ